MSRLNRFAAALLALAPVMAVAQGGFRGPGGFQGWGRYVITNVKSGRVLDMDRNDQSTVIQFAPRGTDNQTWIARPAGGGAFFLRNAMNGYALDMISDQNTARVLCTPFNGGPTQRWRISPSKDGTAVLVSVSGKVIDIPEGDANRDGTHVHVFDRNDGANQRFTFARISGWNTGWHDNDEGEGPGPGPIACSSDDGRRRYCDADTRGGVQLVRQISGSPCEQGRTWGFDGRGIWVDRGCRAEFRVGSGGGGNGDKGAQITCSSDDGGRKFCPADTRNGVRLARQISGSPCIQGQTWGFDRRGVWVDRGCRADFTLGFR